MRFRRAIPPKKVDPLRVAYHSTLALDSQRGVASLDGRQTKVKLGQWMLYVPKEQMKCFHASQGMIDCTHVSRPADIELDKGVLQGGRYTMDEWRGALRTSIYRRLAEIWIVSARLWRAGIGPQPLGVCYVDRLVRDDIVLGPTCGLLTQNVFSLPRKLNCTLEQITAAGVVPDKILSCVRQQMRGYIIDLCSVVGCRPENAEREVEQLEDALRQRPPAEILTQTIEDTIQNQL